MKKHMNVRGETIVEVLLAMTLLTLILFSAWKLVNRSTQLSLTARKRTEMINQLKEQAEIIKNIYANNQDDIMTKFKKKVIDGTSGDATLEYNPDFCKESYLTLGATPPANAFYMAYNESASPGDKLEKVSGPKRVNGDQGSLVWVQWKDNGSVDGHYDFYIRGCWYTSGAQQKTDNAQFVLRLNK